MAKLTEKEMETILYNEVPDSIEVDSGIFEFYKCENVSIGVSYEHVAFDVPAVGYVFNLFVDGQYISIPGVYYNIFHAAKILTEEWNRCQRNNDCGLTGTNEQLIIFFRG